MYLMTSMSFEDLGTLIKTGKVALNNSSMLFGQPVDFIDKYFRDSTGVGSYVVGFRGRLKESTIPALAALDPSIHDEEMAILEIEIDEDDAASYSLDNVLQAYKLFSYGFDDDDVLEEIEAARAAEAKKVFDILCVPYISIGDIGKKIRVTTLHDVLEFPIDSIRFVKMEGYNYDTD